jgi:PhnB protein
MTADEHSPTPATGTVAPWLSVTDGPTALRFYRTAFGAAVRYRLEDRAGRVVVAQLKVGQAEFWLQENRDTHPDSGRGRIHMTLAVKESDAVFRRALAAGATEIAPVSDGHGWRSGRLADPFGHHWEVGSPAKTRE